MTSAPSSLSEPPATRTAFLAACFRFAALLGAHRGAGPSLPRLVFLRCIAVPARVGRHHAHPGQQAASV